GTTSPIDPRHERRCISQLSCPSQHFLISAVDFPGRSRSRDRKLVTTRPEVCPACRRDYLDHDPTEHFVVRRERYGALDLNLENCAIPSRIVRRAASVIERSSLPSTRQLPALGRRTWPARRFRSRYAAQSAVPGRLPSGL